VAQTVSYEVRMALLILTPLFIFHRFNLKNIRDSQVVLPRIIFLAPLRFCWFITNLAETNRAPFDFAEGESEIVSGFNIEYRRGGFAIIFIAEYTNIIFMSFITSLLFLS
jgi:NADH-ubiquinone oxidoreductase chain 1